MATAEAAEDGAPQAGAADAVPDTDAIRTPTAPGGTPARGNPPARAPAAHCLAGAVGGWPGWRPPAPCSPWRLPRPRCAHRGGPGRASAEPPANPVAASTRLSVTPSVSPTTKSPAPKPTARKTHPAHATRSTTASGSAAGGGQQTTSPGLVPTPKVTTPTVAPPSTGTVPSVLGEQLSAAESALEARGFHNIPWVYECLNSTLIEDVDPAEPRRRRLDRAHLARPAVPAGQQLRHGPRRDRVPAGERRDRPPGSGLHELQLVLRLLRLVPGRRRRFPVAFRRHWLWQDQLVSIKLQANNC